MEFGRHVLVKIRNTTFQRELSYSMRTDGHRRYEPSGPFPNFCLKTDGCQTVVYAIRTTDYGQRVVLAVPCY